MMKHKKKYLLGLAILVIAVIALVLSLDESLNEELAVVEKYTETPSPKAVSYLDLPLSEEDKASIYQLLDPLANWSLLSLGLNRKEIEQRGYATKNIPILRYLGYIRMQSELLGFVYKIRRRSKVWKPLEKGFIRGLTGADAKGKIKPYLASFATDTHLDYEILSQFATAKDWASFLHVVLFSK